MIYTASFYAPQNWVGLLYRVSRQHPRGLKAQWEVLPFFYPPLDLLRAYRAGTLTFEQFGYDYKHSLEISYRTSLARNWLDRALNIGDFTFLCFEKAGLPCHRLVLSSWISEKIPELRTGNLF